MEQVNRASYRLLTCFFRALVYLSDSFDSAVTHGGCLFFFFTVRKAAQGHLTKQLKKGKTKTEQKRWTAPQKGNRTRSQKMSQFRVGVLILFSWKSLSSRQQEVQTKEGCSKVYQQRELKLICLLTCTRDLDSTGMSKIRRPCAVGPLERGRVCSQEVQRAVSMKIST